jgi:glutathione reductase (NADPH)
MDRQYDLVVVGTGVTSAVATRCREAGWSVAVVDRRPFGGTCALRGCVPKKILVGAAEAVNGARDMAGKGVPAGALTIDWPELMRFKRLLVDPTTERVEQAWARMGVEQFHGLARFVGPTTLAVGDDRLTGRRILIAAGAVPAPLRFVGAERLTTSEEFLNLDRLPPRVVFVGGGYISCELAHVAARAGAQATILHRGARPLAGFDPDLVDLLVRRTRELGIRVEVDIEVRGIETVGNRLVVRGVQRGEGRSFETDLVVHGAGRVPEIDDLDLDAGGVKRDKRGVTVNQFLQSVSNPADAARAAGRRFRTSRQDTSAWFNTRRVGETTSGFKVLIEEGSGHILGAHLLGPHAEEVINLFSVAIRLRIPAPELQQALFAYPTNGSDVRFML